MRPACPWTKTTPSCGPTRGKQAVDLNSCQPWIIRNIVAVQIDLLLKRNFVYFRVGVVSKL